MLDNNSSSFSEKKRKDVYTPPKLLPQILWNVFVDCNHRMKCIREW